MPDELTRPTHYQLSLLEEPEATLAVRVVAMRGDPFTAVSYTLTRGDGSWLACEVVTCRSGPEAIGTALAEMMGRGMEALDAAVGPF